MSTGRRAHYSGFYDPHSRADVAVVWGNCQAESLRVLLSGSPSFPFPLVRVPPVHELVATDLPALEALLPRVRLLVSQPVRDGYRDLPAGTSEMARRIGDGRVVVVPIVRFVGLHPYAAIVRHPADPGLDPPLVPYHDLRTLARAAGRTPPTPVDGAVLRSVAAASVAELARRERGTDVRVSDVLLSHGAEAAHTLNHPGNPVLIELARRVQAHLGLPVDVGEPGRELLGHVRAPLEEAVVDALGLGVPPRPDWAVGGSLLDPAAVVEAQSAWYGTNPSVVDAGLRRHADRLRLLGL